jgi:hypothetical protein
LPTAPGTDGQWYQSWVNPELDTKIQEMAMRLHKKNRLRDENGKPVKLKMGPDGPYVPRYAVAKYALLQLVNGFSKKGTPTR